MKPKTYHTKRYTLAPYRPKDIDRWVEMAVDPLSVQFMGGATGDAAKERAFFPKVFEIYEKNDARIFWLWGVYENDQLCAHFELKQTTNTSSDELEIVYMVHPDSRGKGLMTEILAFFKKEQAIWGKTIIATLSPENKGSMALLEKWGITKREVRGEQSLKVWLA